MYDRVNPYKILIESRKIAIHAKWRLLRCTITMSRPFKIGVALAVLLAVATVLIAPTIDMPETTLREHQVASHFCSEHAPGGLSTFAVAGTSALQPFGSASRFAVVPHLSKRLRVPSSVVMRC